MACTWLDASHAQSQDAYTCIEDLTEDELDYRIEMIQTGFEEGQNKAAAWRFGWMTAIAGATSLNAYNLVSKESPRAERFFEWGLIGASAFEVLRLAIIPMPDVWGAKRIRKKAGKTLEEKRAKLRYATKTLEKSAKIQEYIQGNTAGGAIIYGVVMGSVYVAKFNDEYGALPQRHERVLARLRAAGLYLLPAAIGIGETITAPMHSSLNWENYRGVACSGQYYDKSNTGPEFDIDFGMMDVRFKVSF